MDTSHERKVLDVQPDTPLGEWMAALSDREGFLQKDRISYRVLCVGAPDIRYPDYARVNLDAWEASWGSWADVDEAIIADLLRGDDVEDSIRPRW
jgi:hypothetical protein